MKVSLVFVAVLYSVQGETGSFTVSVNRRISSDIYCLNSEDSVENCHPETVYLIKEKQCIPDVDLFHAYGCSHMITSARPSTILIPIVEEIESEYSPVKTTNTLTVDGANIDEYVVLFEFNETHQSVNSSFCEISSLEVYRGRQHAIVISHEGFSLNDSGSIELHKDELVYDANEYVGELYRMNISCSDGGLPETGCLFFKVLGRTNTTEYKFNKTVPGTFADARLNDTESVTSTDASPDKSMTTFTPVTVSTTVEEPPVYSTFVPGSGLFYTVMGISGGLILIFSFTIVCVLISVSVAMKAKSGRHTTTTYSHNNLHRLGGQDLWHMHSPAANSNTRQYELAIGSITENHLPEMWSNEEKKQLTRFTSLHNHTEHSLTGADFKEHLEMLQVYDTINPEAWKDRAGDHDREGMVYHQLSHKSPPSYHGKRSLPAYLEGTPEYSALNTGAEASMPVYEAPVAMCAKRQNSRHSAMPSSHKFSTSSCPPLSLVPVGSRSIAHDHDHTYTVLEQDHLRESTHTKAKITAFTSEHAYGVLEEDQTVQSAHSQVEILESESEHTYAILEQKQVEPLTFDDEHITKEMYQEHTYPLLEQDQLVSLHNTQEETQPQLDILEDGEQPTSWNWILESPLSQPAEQEHSRSREVNFEPVQIYSTISPEPHKPIVAETGEVLYQESTKEQSTASQIKVQHMEVDSAIKKVRSQCK